MRERRDEESKKDWAATLKEEGFDNDSALDNTIKKLEADLKRSKKKDEGEEVDVSYILYLNGRLFTILCQPDEPPSFPLVDTPDDEVRSHGSDRAT